MPEEIREHVLNVDQGVLDDRVLQPWRQLIVERLRHESFIARLSLLKLNDIHEIIPSVQVESFSKLARLELAQLVPHVVDILNRAVDIIDEHFRFLRRFGENVVNFHVKFERKESVFDQSKRKDCHELDAGD